MQLGYYMQEVCHWEVVYHKALVKSHLSLVHTYHDLISPCKQPFKSLVAIKMCLYSRVHLCLAMLVRVAEITGVHKKWSVWPFLLMCVE